MPLSVAAKAAQVTRNGGVVAFESVDGRNPYYTQTSTGSSALWRIPTAGGEPQKLVDDVGERAFAVLDKGIDDIEHHQRGTWPWGSSQWPRLLEVRRARTPLSSTLRKALFRIVADLEGWIALGLGVSPDGLYHSLYEGGQPIQRFDDGRELPLESLLQFHRRRGASADISPEEAGRTLPVSHQPCVSPVDCQHLEV